MASFRISITPTRRAAARLITDVRAKLLKAFADNPDVSQRSVAEKIGVNRSVINRQIHGRQDINLGRIAEIAYALGYQPKFELVRISDDTNSNYPVLLAGTVSRGGLNEKTFWSGSRTVRLPLEQPSSSERFVTVEDGQRP